MPTSTARPSGAEVPAPTSAPTSAAASAAAEQPSWRRPGQAHRTALLSADVANGGSDFAFVLVQLNDAVPITKYHQVGRRAYVQFRDGCEYVDDHNGECM